MECALIPPVAALSYNKSQRYQLALPHMLKNSARYHRAYRGYCRGREKYVILDNGAAEGEEVSPSALLTIAQEFQVDEVVAPDVLADFEATIDTSQDFLWWCSAKNVDLKNLKIGVVAQGRNLHEAFTCIQILMASRFDEMISVIYIPRLLVTSNQPQARIMLATAIHDKWPHLEIHFLGASRKWLQEPVATMKMAPYVRSIDTSVPFTEAFHGRLLGKSMVGLARPDDYFNWEPPLGDEAEILRKNVRRYLAWTKGGSIH